MAVPKKGLRTLEFNNKKYGWLIRKSPTYSQEIFQTPMTVAIQELDIDTPKVLHVTLNMDRPDNGIMPHQTSITPKVIRDIITTAVDKGWNSKSGGKPYDFEYSVIKDI